MGGRAKTLSVLVGFNACWFACVLPAAYGLPYVGPIVVLMFSAAVLSMSRNYMGDALLVAAGVVFGYVLDSALVLIGAFTFPPGASWGAPTTWWMVAMWVNLATAMPVLFRWMIGRPFVAAVFGLLGGPSAYYSGEKLGAIELGDNLVFAMIAVGVGWALTMPLGVKLMQRLDGLTLRKVDPEKAEALESRQAAGSESTESPPRSVSEVPA